MNAQLLGQISERDFQGMVVAFAALSGWTFSFHQLDSRGSNAGFPDLILMRPPELLVVELKAEKGRVTEAQSAWIEAFAACGVEARVFRPSDWDEIEARLRRAPSRPMPS